MIRVYGKSQRTSLVELGIFLNENTAYDFLKEKYNITQIKPETIKQHAAFNEVFFKQQDYYYLKKKFKASKNIELEVAKQRGIDQLTRNRIMKKFYADCNKIVCEDLGIKFKYSFIIFKGEDLS